MADLSCVHIVFLFPSIFLLGVGTVIIRVDHAQSGLSAYLCLQQVAGVFAGFLSALIYTGIGVNFSHSALSFLLSNGSVECIFSKLTH